MVQDIYVMQSGFPHPTDAQLHPFQQHCTDGDGSLENQTQTSADCSAQKKASHAIWDALRYPKGLCAAG